jgi:hypothetical protein
LPRNGVRILTNHGTGVVVNRQILTQLVQIQLEDGTRVTVVAEDILEVGVKPGAEPPRPVQAPRDESSERTARENQEKSRTGRRRRPARGEGPAPRGDRPARGGGSGEASGLGPAGGGEAKTGDTPEGEGTKRKKRRGKRRRGRGRPPPEGGGSGPSSPPPSDE